MSTSSVDWAPARSWRRESNSVTELLSERNVSRQALHSLESCATSVVTMGGNLGEEIKELKPSTDGLATQHGKGEEIMLEYAAVFSKGRIMGK